LSLKIFKRVCPYWNEIGVSQDNIHLCEEPNYRVDLKKLQILINSSQQCGRSQLMEIDIVSNNLKHFLLKYPESYILDFSNKILNPNVDIETVLIGCEGGFTQDERDLFKDRVVGTPWS